MVEAAPSTGSGLPFFSGGGLPLLGQGCPFFWWRAPSTGSRLPFFLVAGALSWMRSSWWVPSSWWGLPSPGWWQRHPLVAGSLLKDWWRPPRVGAVSTSRWGGVLPWLWMSPIGGCGAPLNVGHPHPGEGAALTREGTPTQWTATRLRGRQPDTGNGNTHHFSFLLIKMLLFGNFF